MIAIMRKTIAVIPARGGSKGIPKKNIQEVSGHPLIHYSIKAALESNIDEVWVSTDCDEIAAVSEESGAKVLKRPSELAEDDTTTDQVLSHFCLCVKNFDALVTIQCTSPLTRSCDLDKGLDIYWKSDCDSVISVCPDSGGWLCGGYSWRDSSEGMLRAIHADRLLRQDMEPTYRENGAFYITGRKRLLRTKLRISGKILPCVMPRQRSFEVDEPEDLDELRRLQKASV